ncbi:MAG: SIR2 family protein [Fusobacteriaceae bacterium]
MNLINRLFKDEKLNMIVGDYFTKKSGFPSRTTLAKLFLLDFNEEQKKYIDDKSSFAKISQAYLDLGIGNRTSMLRKIEELYRCAKHETVVYEDFIIPNAINSIISFDYDVNLEEIYEDNKFSKIIQNKISSLENKRSLYKIFGDLSDEDKMIITSQDIRKYTVLPVYKEYLSLVRKEFTKEKTLILGSDFENTDLIDFLDFLFKICKKEELKPIYYLSSQSIFGKKTNEFIEKYSIKIIDIKDEKKFLESLKNPVSIVKEQKVLEFSREKEFLKEKTFNTEIITELSEVSEVITTNIEKNVLELSEKTQNLYVKTAAELKFDSLQLKKNPIRFTNIPISLNYNELKFIKINSFELKIGDEKVTGIKLRIIKNMKLNFLEIKSREFKIKFSISINNLGSLNSTNEYLEYEIFKTINPNRFKNILNLFLNIFMGKPLSFVANGKEHIINLKDEIHYLKFQIIKETEKIYNETFEKLKIQNENKFYSSPTNYYLIHLLNKYCEERIYESWINMYIDEKTDLNTVNKIKITREHEINIKSFSGVLLETIEMLDEVKKEDLIKHNGKYLFKQNKVKITLEKIEK